MPADKGNVTVMMKTEEFHTKFQEMLEPTTCRMLNKDPTQIRLTTIAEDSPIIWLIKGSHGRHDIPIVSAPGSPTYNKAKYLATLLQPHARHTSSYIKDFMHFVEKVNTHNRYLREL